MVEIWLCRKCGKSDELVQPKHSNAGGVCADCGGTADVVWLHERVKVKEATPEQVETIKEMLAEEPEEAESIPDLAEVLIVAESVPSVRLVDEEGTETTVDEVLEKVEVATEEKIVEKVEEAVIEAETVESTEEPAEAPLEEPEEKSKDSTTEEAEENLTPENTTGESVEAVSKPIEKMTKAELLEHLKGLEAEK